MRFFSKLTVVCNICFLLSVVFWYIEIGQKHAGNDVKLIPLPWLEGTLVIIGYGAIIINLFFLLVYLIFSSFKVKMAVPKWMLIFNVLIFIGQIYFHFILK